MSGRGWGGAAGGALTTFQMGLSRHCGAGATGLRGSPPGQGWRGEAPLRSHWPGSSPQLASLPFRTILGQVLGARSVPAPCQVPGLEVSKAVSRTPWSSGTGVGAGRHAQLSYERDMLAPVVLCSFGFAGTFPCMDTHILTIS